MSLQEIQSVTGGVILGRDAQFRAVSIDTRTLQANDLFIAIQGPNFDGNDFVKDAAAKNACGAVVSKPCESPMPMLVVADTREALVRIGSLNRDRCDACVIALTGSQGKTTVKEMTAGILGECGQVEMTRGNLNNDLGVPLSLSRIDDHDEYAVIELGANGPGEIAYTVGMTRPTIAHITNIADTHLEGFGDLDGVARAKAEIWQGIEPGGTAVVNLDDDYAGQFIDGIRGDAADRKLVTVSAAGNTAADYAAVDITLKGFLGASFTLRSPQGTVGIDLEVVGMHNVRNAVAAAALAMSAGADLAQVKSGLEKFTPVKGRLNILSGLNNAIVIDDSYNASPSSFRAAIDALVLMPGKRIVVMGDMGELGHEAERAHRDIGRYARETGVGYLLGVGPLSALAAESFGEGGVSLEDRTLFADAVHPLMDEETTILVKGSRSQRMEELVQQLLVGLE